MASNNNGVMVALLPIISDWPNLDFPHLTLVYAGLEEDVPTSTLDALSKAALSIALMSRPVTLRTLTKDVFGEGTEDSPKVDVIRFHPNLDLFKMRAVVEQWDASQFPFNPHLTVGPEGSWNGTAPIMVAFDKVCFSVGDKRQEFQLSRNFGGMDGGDW